MRRGAWVLGALLLGGCPSLDGFSGKESSDGGPGGSGYLSLNDAARLCSQLQTCPQLGYSIAFSLLIPLEKIGYSVCVDRLAGPLPPGRPGVSQQAQSLSCAAQATSCATAAACFPYEFIEATDPRCQGLDGGTDGGTDGGPDAGGGGGSATTSSCSPDKKSVYECKFKQILHCDHPYFYPGSTCLLDSTGVPRCAVAASCTASETTCSGNVVLYCGAVSNFAYGDDCSFWGATCGKDQSAGVQDCILNGLTPFCSEDSVQCISNRLRTCSGGFFSEYDCGALGGKCELAPTPHCAPASPACTHSDPDVGKCTGSQLKLCIAGQPKSLDCASLGLACKEGAFGGYCG